MSKHEKRVAASKNFVETSLRGLRITSDGEGLVSEQIDRKAGSHVVSGLVSAAERLQGMIEGGPYQFTRWLGGVTWGETRRGIEARAKQADTAKLALAGLHRFVTTVSKEGTVSPSGDVWSDSLRFRHVARDYRFYEFGSAALALDLDGTHVTVSSRRDEGTAITAQPPTPGEPTFSEEDKWAIGWAQATTELLADSALESDYSHSHDRTTYSITSPYGSERSNSTPPIWPVRPDAQPPMMVVSVGQPEQPNAILGSVPA